ncbi:hypothetical protein Bca52824_058308 [Brassica carinata]|uniref:Uncharacterized protein n=1 Tax=Brassica carinata TaxID=52824 RepID=A0A8X7QSJ9_BRACI|nr:hypothetical protein Bca52824_058308 [Brassica carinata]
MEARKGIVCGLAASGVKPQLKQQQPQQEALNTEQERGQSSGGNEVEEITRTEFRRIEEPEEDIDPDYLHYLRAIGAYNSAPVRRPQQQRQSSRGQSSGGNDVEEITRTEFRRSQGYLIRIEEPGEDIDPMFLHSQGQSSRTKGGRHY